MFCFVQKLAEELKNEKGSVHPVKVDLRKEKDIVAAFSWVKANLGGVDVLINNAGVAIRTRVMGKPNCVLCLNAFLFCVRICVCTRESQ